MADDNNVFELIPHQVCRSLCSLAHASIAILRGEDDHIVVETKTSLKFFPQSMKHAPLELEITLPNGEITRVAGRLRFDRTEGSATRFVFKPSAGQCTDAIEFNAREGTCNVIQLVFVFRKTERLPYENATYFAA